MKKVLIFLAIIIVLFSGVAILTNMQNSEKVEDNPYGKDTLHPETAALLEDENYQNIILPDELDQKLKDKEDITVYYFQSTCEYCKQATPILSPLAEEMGIDLLQYNLLEFEQGWDDYGIQETPTIVQYKDGKEVARITGLTSEDEYRQWFTENSQKK
ncbi:thioredoxin family protein [Niallia oryzisoli]|uniref:Thioredoxin family protein n=1 Tax=Niallia oryzisoli TaxID=1737571 RepID=A0ABZ2CH06_9BACI